MNKKVAVVAIWACLTCTAFAQDAVPDEILQRTLAIQFGNGGGTAFSIDYHGKLYLVTARHVVEGLPESNGTIQILRPDGWKNYHIVKTLFPPSRDADIAVLETDEKAAQPYLVAVSGKDEGPTMGQHVWFLGYPFRERLHSHFGNSKEAPFIKRGTMSAIDSSDPNAVVEYIDGFNNEGFSGGPIVYWEFSKRSYRIVGVVRGYKPEAAKTLVNGVPIDTALLVNSGILIGYSIEHAIQAIEQANKP
jgi:trypsin-like peptidase